MLIKRSLSAVMVASFMVPTALPSLSLGQVRPIVATPANDAISLIVRAMIAKTPQEARALLAEAKLKAASEQLPADTLDTINALLNDASQKLSKQQGNNPLSGGKPISFTVGDQPATQTATPAKPTAPGQDSATIIANLLRGNPDLHKSMSEIMIGRLQRDSSNLEAIVQANSNQSILATDKVNAATDAVLSTASALIKALRDGHVLTDWGPINRALLAKNDSIPIDDLASDIVLHSSFKSLLAGMIKKIINASGISTKQEFAGISIEALGVFAINADLVLRLADLYGMNLSESQQDVAILTILPLTKLFIFSARNRALVKQTTEALADRFAEAKANPRPGTMGRFYAAVFSSQMMSAIAARMGLGGHLIASKEAVEQRRQKLEAARLEAAPVTAPAAAAVPVAAPATAAGQKIEAAIAKIENVAAGAETVATPVAGKVAGVVEKVAKTPLSWKSQAIWLLASTLQSGAETYATGRVAMWWFDREKRQARATESANFHSFLMQDNGRGFFKLLIATMNNGTPGAPPVIDIRTSRDPRADFIMNIARSIRICSPADAARYKVLQAKANGSALIRAANMIDSDYKLLRFACSGNLGFERYNEIAKEFLTFNGIPGWEVAALRTANYSDRVQMGELLMQLQFLTGEPTAEQNHFFRTTIAKFLGLERIEDFHYFSRFYAFIRENGGMAQNVSTPTGWSIGASDAADPYASAAAYTSPGAPDFPAPPAAAVVTPPPVVVKPPGPVVVTPPVVTTQPAPVVVAQPAPIAAAPPIVITLPGVK
jgi:hypothetical protein